jgi:hypothetical protein
MFCPTCHAALQARSDACPACGHTLRPIQRTDSVEVVEVMQPSLPGTAAPLARPRPAPVLARFPRLGLAAWQRPAIRTAVRTGATALALSLTLRVVRGWMAAQRPRDTLATGILPRVVELLRQDAGVSERRLPHCEVEETIIVARRVVRR